MDRISTRDAVHSHGFKAAVTRRAVLRTISGGAIGVAVTSVVGWSGFIGQAAVAPSIALAVDDTPVFPAGGAGLFDVDPAQSGVSQDPAVALTGDVAALPEGMEL